MCTWLRSMLTMQMTSLCSSDEVDVSGTGVEATHAMQPSGGSSSLAGLLCCVYMYNNLTRTMLGHQLVQRAVQQQQQPQPLQQLAHPSLPKPPHQVLLLTLLITLQLIPLIPRRLSCSTPGQVIDRHGCEHAFAFA
jgi:hypothetical protein